MYGGMLFGTPYSPVGTGIFVTIDEAINHVASCGTFISSPAIPGCPLPSPFSYLVQRYGRMGPCLIVAPLPSVSSRSGLAVERRGFHRPKPLLYPPLSKPPRRTGERIFDAVFGLVPPCNFLCCASTEGDASCWHTSQRGAWQGGRVYDSPS